MSTVRIRLAAIGAAVAGLLFLAYPATRPWSDESTVDGARTSMGSGWWVFAHLSAMVGFILVPLTLLAVHGVLARTAAERSAATAVVLTWIGAGLTLPCYGAEDFGLHAIATHLKPGVDLLDLVRAVRYQPVAITTFGLGLVLLAAGAVVAAVAIWRSGVLPRFSGVVFGLGFALFLPQFFAGPVVRIGHGVMMAVGLVWLGVALWSTAGRDGGTGERPQRRTVHRTQ